MPILTLRKVRTVSAGPEPVQNYSLLDRWTSFRDVATWCLGPFHRNSQILRAFLKLYILSGELHL